MNAYTFHNSTQCGIPLWLSAMWLYTCMILIFYSAPIMFFCDATMYIYDDSDARQPHSCWMWDKVFKYGLADSYGPPYDVDFDFQPKKDSVRPLHWCWMCHSPQTGCAWRIAPTIYISGTNRVIVAHDLYCCLLLELSDHNNSNLAFWPSQWWHTAAQHFENRGTIYSYFDFSLKQQFSVALPTP